jgi:hypothetical protein
VTKGDLHRSLWRFPRWLRESYSDDLLQDAAVAELEGESVAVALTRSARAYSRSFMATHGGGRLGLLHEGVCETAHDPWPQADAALTLEKIFAAAPLAAVKFLAGGRGRGTSLARRELLGIVSAAQLCYE